ncbi:MAG TPA: hypothetical protein ENN67_07600 [Firmicutes bacterium]|nr:hypothetical protein [Bacillota bacterium]
MLRQLAIPIILVMVVFGVWLVWLSVGGLLNTQNVKERELGRVAAEKLRTHELTSANFVSIRHAGPGEYIMMTKGLSDALETGRFAHNAMVILDERNTALKTGRSHFRIIGQQDRRMIFDVVWNFSGFPRVTLHGPFENYEYELGTGLMKYGEVKTEQPKIMIPD